MPRVTDTDFVKAVKADNISSLYFFHGKEIYLMEKSLSLLLKKVLGPNPSDFNYQKFDSRNTPIEDIQNAVETLPFMAQRKCVVVNNLDIEKLKTEDLEALNHIVENTYDSCIVIFYLSGIEINLKKQDKWKKFEALCSKHGTVVEFAQKDKREIAKALSSYAQKNNAILSTQNASYLIDISGYSLHTLYNEVDKLCFFANGSEITKSMIDISATVSIESSSFDLAKAVVHKNYGRAFEILNELFYQKIRPEIILGALSSTFIDLYRAAAAKENNKNASDIINDFNYSPNLSFVVTNAMRDIKGTTASTMRRFIVAIYEADIKIKSSSTDNKIILEELIGKMIAVEKKL